MSYIDIKNFKFDDSTLRGFNILFIDDIDCNITDIEVIFQKNRAIVFRIIINDNSLINYLNKERISNLKGQYYHYSFVVTIDNIKNTGYHSPFFNYDIVVDLIEFSKQNSFFINTESKKQLQIIPTKNMIEYMKRINENDLFKFNDISYQEYNLKIKYLLELNSLIYNTPILIEKVIINNDEINNILFQSQNINKHTTNRLKEIYPLLKYSHFVPNLEKHLDGYIKFKDSSNTIDLLLKTYFIDDLINAKETYNLNDISGFIDLFDGIFFSLEGKLEKKEFICSECNKTKKTKGKSKPLNEKIDFIANKLEPSLKQFKYDIDKDEEVAKVLSDFRNMIRHQKDFKEFNLNKIMIFTKGVLKLFIIKYILKIGSNDYNIGRILSDFNIYPLVEHKYKYNDEEIIIYDTNLQSQNRTFVSNTIAYQTLVSYDKFKNAKPSDFIYDETHTKEIRKIYIDDNDKIRRALIFFCIIIHDKDILQGEKETYPLSMSYDELIKNLLEK